jgi:hypothetical protein
MTIIPDRLATIEDLTLLSGGHDENLDGLMCVMEAVAFVAGERWTDHPQCASPVIGGFMRTLNDRLDDEARQQLKPYIARLVGSAGTPEQEEQRRWMCANWLIHTSLPLWLRKAGMDKEADRASGLASVSSQAEWDAHYSTLVAIRKAAWAKSDGWREKVRRAVRQAVEEKLKDQAAAAAAAVAVAVAVAVDAVAAAVAAAAAAVAAVAVAAAVAAAVDAVAVADVAAAVAVAAASSSGVYWPVRNAVAQALRALVQPTADLALREGLALLEDLLAVTE